MSAERFVDESPFLPPGTPLPPPQLFGGLLNRLRINNQPVAEQDQAIRVWLTSNEPSPTLEFSIRRAGRGYLLESVRPEDES